MLPCIDETHKQRIARARDYEVVEFIRDAVTDVDGDCFKDLAKELGLSYGTLYAFKSGRTAAPAYATLQKLLSYFAPGYEIAIAPIEQVPVVCAIRRPPASAWELMPDHPGFEWEKLNGKPTGQVRPVALATAAE